MGCVKRLVAWENAMPKFRKEKLKPVSQTADTGLDAGRREFLV